MPKGKVGNPNLRGNKNSGRKSLAEEIAGAKERITQDILVELANTKVFAAINGANTHKKIKEIALPITLKGITNKSENTLILPKPIDDVLQDFGLQKNKDIEQTDKNNTGGNECEQDS